MFYTLTHVHSLPTTFRRPNTECQKFVTCRASGTKPRRWNHSPSPRDSSSHNNNYWYKKKPTTNQRWCKEFVLLLIIKKKKFANGIHKVPRSFSCSVSVQSVCVLNTITISISLNQSLMPSVCATDSCHGNYPSVSRLLLFSCHK